MENKYKIIELPKNFDPRGNLTVVEQGINIPFDMKTISWKYKMCHDKTYPSETQADNYQFLVALHGAFCIKLSYDDPTESTLSLSNPHQGIIIYPNTKYEITTVQEDTVILELSSK